MRGPSFTLAPLRDACQLRRVNKAQSKQVYHAKRQLLAHWPPPAHRQNLPGINHAASKPADSRGQEAFES